MMIEDDGITCSNAKPFAIVIKFHKTTRDLSNLKYYSMLKSEDVCKEQISNRYFKK